MRTFRKSMLIAMIVMVATVGFANGNKPNVKVEKVGAKTIALYASGLGAGKTQVQLKDENGLILHQMVSDNNQKVVKKFDLKALPVGNYTLETENESSFTTVPIVISTSEVVVKQADQIIIIKPVIRQNGNLLDIIMPNEDSTQVSIIIYDSNSNRLYKEILESSTELRRYNFSKLDKGGYTIKMRAHGKDFIQFVALK